MQADGERHKSSLVDAAGSVVDRVDAPVGPPRQRQSPGVAAASRLSTGRLKGTEFSHSSQPGKLSRLLTDGSDEPVPLDFGGAAGSVIEPAWSPTGQSIAFISESEDGETRSLRMLDTSTGEIYDRRHPACRASRRRLRLVARRRVALVHRRRGPGQRNHGDRPVASRRKREESRAGRQRRNGGSRCQDHQSQSRRQMDEAWRTRCLFQDREDQRSTVSGYGVLRLA